jgi:hypothetical protein
VEVADATDTQNAGSVVFRHPVGDDRSPTTDPQQATWNVLRVTRPAPDARAPGAPGHPVAAAALPHRASATLQRVADDLAVRVNPRYACGTRFSLRVVPANQTTGLVLAASR